jgi:chorismate mutase
MTLHAVAEPPKAPALQGQLDRIDLQIIALVRQRAVVARQVREARLAAGETGYAHEEELAVARRFGQLGPYGAELAAILLRRR